MNSKKFNEIIEDCLEELYQNSTPKASFKKLKEEAIENNNKNSFGEYVIPFNDYSIDNDKFTEIVDEYKNKFKKKYELAQFLFYINLGPSPKSIKED